MRTQPMRHIMLDLSATRRQDGRNLLHARGLLVNEARPGKHRIKHPVLIAMSLPFLAFLIFLFYPAKPDPPRKKLDYSKPIFTSEYALVCPQSLLRDPSVDRGLPAVTDLFESLTNRAEKARAIGCEDFAVSLPVYNVERMADPFDGYAAISLKPHQPAGLFTMEAYLTNGDSALSSDSTGPNQAVGDPIDPTDPYKADRLDFQKVFPKLVKPEANLRWDPMPAMSGPDNQEMTTLVTPYGPCAALSGNTGGYAVLAVDLNPSKHPFIVGTSPSRDGAVQVAIKHCETWYADLQSQPPDPLREQHTWFAPDADPMVQVGSSAAQADTTPEQRDSGVDAVPGPERSPAPIVRIQPLKRTIAANGDEVLSGASGQCAILAVSPEDKSKIQLTFADRTIQVFGADESVRAEAAAAEHCEAAMGEQ